jgi:hypothetical protein
VLTCVGTKEGKVLVFNISSTANSKLAESRGGLSFGPISSIDVNGDLDKIVCGTASGELFTLDILTSVSDVQL